jgi:hypothetical protein
MNKGKTVFTQFTQRDSLRDIENCLLHDQPTKFAKPRLLIIKLIFSNMIRQISTKI